MFDFRFYKACMGQIQLVYKVQWGYNMFIDENLGRAKGFKFFSPSPFHKGFLLLLWGFNRYKQWIIQLN